MGETMTDTLKDEIEVKEPLASEKVFEASVSFGRFENDLLSWERWSSFSQNKYLEEVEKCSTPGSVAKKKAYFEAHYKKIAARKAKLLEQEQEMGVDPLRSDYPSSGNPTSNGCGTNVDFDTLNVDRITKSVDPDTSSIAAVSNICIDDPNKDAVSIDLQGSFTDGGKEEVASRPDSPKSNSSVVTVSVQEENHSIGSQGQSEDLAVKEEIHLTGSQADSEVETILFKEENHSIKSQSKLEEVAILVKEENNSTRSEVQLEHPQELHNKTGNSEVNKMEDAKLKPLKESEKRTSASKEKNLGRTKNKLAAPTPISAHTSIKKTLKPVPVTPSISASRMSTKKESSPSLPRNRKSSAMERKRPTPTSLHMSLSLGSTNYDSASSNTIRRSFIMEKMGDKEIVKRAFKTFQNNHNPSYPSVQAKSSISPKASMKHAEQSALASMTPRKDKDGARKALEKVSSQKGQVGARWNSVSAGPVKSAGVNQISVKAVPSFGLRSEARAEKRKEFFKKLEKSNAEEVEKTHLQSKSKGEKDAEIKKLRQSLNVKATPMPDFNKGKGVSKTHVNKESASKEILHRQPVSQGRR